MFKRLFFYLENKVFIGLEALFCVPILIQNFRDTKQDVFM